MDRYKYSKMTLEHLRGLGCFPFQAERRIPPREGLPFGKTVDLMGFADIFVLDPKGQCSYLVQSTGPGGYQPHLETILTNPHAATYVLKCQGHIVLYSWRKLLVKRGGKRRTWQPRILSLTLETWGNEVEEYNERREKNRHNAGDPLAPRTG